MALNINVESDTDAVTAYETAFRVGKHLRGQGIYSTGQETDFLTDIVEIPLRNHRHYALIRAGFIAGMRGHQRGAAED